MGRIQQDGPGSSILGTLAFMLIGPIAWAAHLTTIYLAATLLCVLQARSDSGLDMAVRPFILMVTGIALLTVALAAVRPGRVRTALRVEAEQAWTTRVMRGLALLSCFGIFWAGATVLILPVCQQLR